MSDCPRCGQNANPALRHRIEKQCIEALQARVRGLEEKLSIEADKSFELASELDEIRAAYAELEKRVPKVMRPNVVKGGEA
jgi:hypothetical protein